MATTRRTIVELLFDGSQASRATLKLGQDIRDLDVTVEKSRRGWTRFGEAMNVALGTLAAQGAVAAARALNSLARRGIRELNDAVRLAGIQQIADRKLEQALRNMGVGAEDALPALKQLAEETASYSNFTDEAIITAQAFLASFQEVSGPQGIALLTPRLADVAAGVAKVTGETADLNQIAALMGRALTSGAGALTEVGVSLTEAQRAAFGAAEGIERVNILAEILDGNFKGLAAATADPFRQLDNAVNQLKESIGTALLPDLQEMSRELIALAQSEEAKELATFLGEQLAAAVRDLGEFVRRDSPKIIEFFREIERLGVQFDQFTLGARTAILSALNIPLSNADLDEYVRLYKETAETTKDVAETAPDAAAGLHDYASAATTAAGAVAELSEAQRLQQLRDKAPGDLTEQDLIVLRLAALKEEANATAEELRLTNAELLNMSREATEAANAALSLETALDVRLGPGILQLPKHLKDIIDKSEKAGEVADNSFNEIGVNAAIAFGEALVVSVYEAGSAIEALKSIVANVFSSVLRTIAISLAESAAAAAVAQEWGRAARLSLAAGVILGASRLIGRIADDRSSSQLNTSNRTNAIRAAGNSIASSGGAAGSNFTPNQGNIQGPSEILLRAYGSELRSVVRFEEGQLEQVRRL